MQNVDIMLDAAWRLKDNQDIRFTIIGDGLYKEKLKSQAEHAQLENVVFLPMQDSGLAPAIYATADLNVIPLAENIYRTALPSKTATCLACGKPVVFCFGTRSRFIKMIEDESGCQNLCAESVDALCEGIKSVKEKGGTGKTADVFVKHMSRTKNAKMYADVILSSGTSGKICR